MILINAYNVIKGGGINVVISIIDSFLNEDEKVIIVIPDIKVYRDYLRSLAADKAEKIFRVVYSRPGLIRFILKFFINQYQLPALVKKYQIKKVFSLGNIGFATSAKQAVLVQNAYATLTDERVWKRIPFLQRSYLKLMQKQILSCLRFANIIAVQTNTVKNDIEKLLNVDEQRIIICPNAVRTDMFEYADVVKKNDKNYNFLFISKLYPHKNFEILEPLATEILKDNIQATITLTLDDNIASEKIKADELIAKFPTIFNNYGFVKYADLPKLYLSHDAIFFPTLLESFSATYIEAMIFNKTIVTSDLPFAREICDDLAFYFDPFDVKDAVAVIKHVINDKDAQLRKINGYQNKLKILNGVNFAINNKRLYNAI